MRDKGHMEEVERWAEFVRTHPRSEWKTKLNIFIDAQYDMAKRFYDNLRKTEKGKEILERLKKERMKVKGRKI